jgi:hypothetical protein
MKLGGVALDAAAILTPVPAPRFELIVLKGVMATEGSDEEHLVRFIASPPLGPVRLSELRSGLNLDAAVGPWVKLLLTSSLGLRRKQTEMVTGWRGGFLRLFNSAAAT